MVAEQAVDQHDVAGARVMRAELDAFADHADAGRGEEQLVAGAAFCTTLVSPVTIATPASRAVSAIEARDPTQQVDRQPFLDDRGAGQIERDRAADREIVDRAATASLPMSPPGKNSGSTTKELVVNASRSPRRARSARSSRA